MWLRHSVLNVGEGNSSVRTLSATGTKGDGTASRTSPTEKPGKPGTVDVEDPPNGPLILVLNVTVTDETPGWQGKVTCTETGP